MSSAPAPTTPALDPTCTPGLAARICVEISLTGPLAVSGQADAPAPQRAGSDPSTTCAALAADHDGGNLGDHLDNVGGHRVSWDAAITDYQGPGTYAGTEVHVTIDDETYSLGDTSRVAIDIRSDFATTLTLTDLSVTSGASAELSGAITWTCLDPNTS